MAQVPPVTVPLFRAPAATAAAHPSSAHVYDPETQRAYQVSIEVITPELAQRYLGTQVVNRLPKQGVIDNKLVPDIRAALWELNGETIIFDVDGVLRDGQHRLLAIVKADVAVKSFVVRGVDPESVRTIDTGTSRSVGDHLGLKGEPNRYRMGAIARALLVYQETGSFDSSSNTQRSTAQIDAFLSDHAWLAVVREATEFTVSVCHSRKGEPLIVLSGGLYGLLYILFKGKDPDIAREFFTRVFSDVGHAPGDPELALRRKLLNAKKDKERLPVLHLAYLFILAWNHRQERTQWKVAKAPREGEQFRMPTISAASAKAYAPGPLR